MAKKVQYYLYGDKAQTILRRAGQRCEHFDPATKAWVVDGNARAAIFSGGDAKEITLQEAKKVAKRLWPQLEFDG